jgi:hypothetical protein
MKSIALLALLTVEGSAFAPSFVGTKGGYKQARKREKEMERERESIKFVSERCLENKHAFSKIPLFVKLETVAGHRT